ncbi:MAG: DNA translocase FtsK [bacterium]
MKRKKRVSKLSQSKPSFLTFELHALLFFALAVFCFILDFFSGGLGVVGRYVYKGLSFLLGEAYFYLTWIYLFMASLVSLFFYARLKGVLLVLGASFLLSLLFFQVLSVSVFRDFSSLLLQSRTGFIGATLTYICTPLIGSVGVVLFFFVGQLMAFVYLFQVSLRRLFVVFYEWFRVALRHVSWKRVFRFLFFTRRGHMSLVGKFSRLSQRKDQRESDVPDPSLSLIKSDEETEPIVDISEDFLDDASNVDQLQSDVPKIALDQGAVEKVSFVLPPIELLKKSKRLLPKKTQHKTNEQQAKTLEAALQSFHVDAKVIDITSGPSVTRFELQPGAGVKVSRITSLSKDIALKLAVPDVRIEAPIPGKALVGIEVPSLTSETVTLRSIFESVDLSKQVSKLIAGLGFTITGEAIAMDLAKMPHVLIAGATGSGKSVCINTLIISILMRATPDEVKFLMIDPKKVELSLYEGIPHLLSPVVTDPTLAAATLKKWGLLEMERRYETFTKVGVKDINGYNRWVKETLAKNTDSVEEGGIELKPLPYIVVVIDELADLMMVARDVEQTICRLAQMSRATGIHLVVATQRPSVNVVTGLIKANIPSRISFFLQSQIDSRTILDMAGAEKLLGKGDMLYSPVGSLRVMRAQGVFVSEDEVKGIVSWLKRQGSPDYVNEILSIDVKEVDESKKADDEDVDVLYEDAKQLIISTRYASTSYLQRKLRIGYNRAARIMDQLEEKGVIAEYVGERKSRPAAQPNG